MPDTPVTRAATGDVISGRYRLVEPVPGGWLAHDELLDKPVTATPTGNGAGVAEPLDDQLRTMGAARQAAAVHHPGVLGVLDVVWQPGRSWIITEHVPARTLRQEVDAAGRLSSRRTAEIGLAALQALRAAHAAGVRHGRVSADALMLTTDGRTMLTGLGVTADQGATGSDDLRSLGSTLRDAAASVPATEAAGAPLGQAIEVLRGAGTATPTAETGPAGHGNPTAEADPAEAAAERAAALLRMAVEQPEPRASPDTETTPQTSVVARVPVPSPPPPPVPPTAPEAGPADDPGTKSGVRVAAGLTLAALAAVAAVAVATRSGRDDADAPTPVAAATTAGSGAGSGTSAPAPDTTVVDPSCRADLAASVRPASQPQPYALPDGWLWHTGTDGLTVAVPRGWTEAVSGTRTCFRDPDSSRTLVVDTSARLVESPVEHWRQAEAAALGDQTLPGYRRLDLGPVDAKEGGAAWEYTWRPDGGAVRHERRLLLSLGSGRAYLVEWSTAEPDWADSEPFLRLVMASLS
ncbi:hypothetical protein [Mangrovihabitans endophyticus]|uniref:Protein kinase domain-containing protein n=1 Tax=Mangrovihabitans endophyticus TaxID=1751298 RepID=A0A8J3FPT7_9ACTN|nr:hypothetical protein [Mangrovihabitans endophyticus]GGK98240.1 hypothetical protein GCM10012284_35600 [Mangrovihabitans endophyticus]